VAARQDLEHNATLYTNMSNRFKELEEENLGCTDELEEILDGKNSKLCTTEKEAIEWTKERQDLLVRLGQIKVEKFNYIYKLLPMMISCMLQIHDYKKSLSEFNMDIHTQWGKGLSVDKTDKEILEKEYPFVTKVAKGYRHFVAELMKVHPGPAPVATSSAPTGSASLVGAVVSSTQKETKFVRGFVE
ncbi:hypothetical protein Tco_0475301, partial [Tanacetum coccineum]